MTERSEGYEQQAKRLRVDESEARDTSTVPAKQARAKRLRVDESEAVASR
jgi:hypothetical protein